MKTKFYKFECSSCCKVSTVKAKGISVTHDIRKNRYYFDITCPECKNRRTYEMKSNG